MAVESEIQSTGEDFSQVELALALRNHGFPLEMLRYDITPLGLHYLLIHFDIPHVDVTAWKLDDRRARLAADLALARGAEGAAEGRASP